MESGAVRLNNETGYLEDTSTGQKVDPETGERLTETPDVPETPAIPDTPGNQENPESPGTPENPENPGRKAAYALLAKDDPAYERMPCRVIEGIDDERAVTLLHAANYFTRALTVTERAAATEALRGDAVRLRSEDPSLSGMRVDDVKAAIIERQTGRKVSGKTIAREERLARRIAEDLSPEWAAEADRGNLSAEAVRSLAGMPKERQAEMHAAMEPWRRTKRELSDYVRSESKTQAGPDGRIAKAARLVADFLESPPESPSAADLSLLREMALMTAPYAEAGAGARKVRRRASHSKSSK